MSQWYYAHGGQQKGPVPISELQRLAANGEFDPAKDLVWKEGMPDWKFASAIPELESLNPNRPIPAPSADPSTAETPAPASRSQPENPYAAPSTDWSESTPSAGGGISGLEEIIPGSQPLDIGACISRAFELTKRHFGQLLLIGIVMIAVSAGVAMIMGLIDSLLGWGGIEVEEITGEEQVDQIIAGFTSNGSILNQIVCNVVDVFLGLGITRVALNVVSGQPYTLGLLFSQGGKTIRGFFAEILFGLMIVVGFLLLIVPGVYLALRYGQYKNAIVDKDMGIFEAFAYSSQITQGNKLSLLGLFMLCILIVIAGALALLVGLLFAIPLVTLASVVAYRWLQYGGASVEAR